MQYTTILAAILPALALAAPQGAAPAANVKNNCASTIYLRSQDQAAGSQPGPVHSLAPGATYSQPQAGAQNIYVGRYNGLKAPLTMGYSFGNGLTYFDLSDQFGNGFSGKTNSIVTSTQGCPVVSCPPNDEACYSNGDHLHIETCQGPTALTLTLCA